MWLATLVLNHLAMSQFTFFYSWIWKFRTLHSSAHSFLVKEFHIFIIYRTITMTNIINGGGRGSAHKNIRTKWKAFKSNDDLMHLLFVFFRFEIVKLLNYNSLGLMVLVCFVSLLSRLIYGSYVRTWNDLSSISINNLMNVYVHHLIK